MIRIQRGAEPPELVEVRARRLVTATAARAAGEKIQFVDYDVVKPQLAAMQHNKCGYCEKREEQAKYRDVDHHRPKSAYWWLAWTWENLLFTCIECNREHKRDQYPLDTGDPLSEHQAPPGNEQPSLLDPTEPSFEPAVHFQFRPHRVQKQERWVPYGLTDRGRKTIEICGLDRPSLLDLYKKHVQEIVRPKLAGFEIARKLGEARAIHDEWSTATRGLLHRERPFRALSRDALAVLVPAEVRDRHQLTLPRLT